MKRLFLLLLLCTMIRVSSNAQEIFNTVHISDGEEYEGIKDDDTQTILVMIDGQLLERGHVTFELYKGSILIDTIKVNYNTRKSSAMVNAHWLRRIEMSDSLCVNVVAYSGDIETKDEVYHISFPPNPERIDHIVVNILHKNRKWHKKHIYSYITMAYYRNDIMLGSTGGGKYGKWFARRYTFYKVE